MYRYNLTDEVFTAQFADCHFNKDVFPPLGGEKPITEEWREIESSFSHLEPPPPTKQSELEVQKIIHLQNLSNRLPDAFIDSTKVTKSHIPVANIQAHISSFNPFTFVCSSEALNLTLFLFLGIVSFEPIGHWSFNCGLGSLATLYFNFPIGISICDGIFVAGICDFVTFVESINASGNRFARFCK